MFRGSVGSLVLTSHSSKGALNIQAEVTLPGTEAAHSPQLWGIREGDSWGCPTANPLLPPPGCSSGLSRDGGLVPRGVGEQPPCSRGSWIEGCFGASPAHCSAFLHTLVCLVSFFPAFSCFCSGALLWCWLSLPVLPCPSLRVCGAAGTLGLARLPCKGSKKPRLRGSWLVHPLHPAQPEDFTGVCREHGVHLCIGGGTLRADGSSGILAQAREDVPTAAWGKRGTSFSPSPLGLCRGFLL